MSEGRAARTEEEFKEEPLMAAFEAETQSSSCTAQQGRRRWMSWLIAAALILAAGALYAGWGWLAAMGLTGVIVAVAPCLAMCALGLCMRGTHAKRE
jgi:hypothetical protein